MNKRIKKKHRPRFTVVMLALSIDKLEQKVGHEIDHKIKRSLINRRLREHRKEPKRREMVAFSTDLLDKIRTASIE